MGISSADERIRKNLRVSMAASVRSYAVVICYSSEELYCDVRE